MAFLKGHRFPVEFDEAFPQGLVLVGEIEPDLEYQSQEDRARNKEQRQRVDESTKLRRWKATVTDPHEQKAKRASFEVIFLADVQPAPLPPEVLPGFRQVELTGLMAAPKVAGQGEFSTSHSTSSPPVCRHRAHQRAPTTTPGLLARTRSRPRTRALALVTAKRLVATRRPPDPI